MTDDLPTASRLQYAPLAGLSWLHFANDGAANFLPGILPAILVNLGLPTSMAGALMFALLAGQGLQPVTGLLGRTLGGRRLMWFGVAGALVGAALVGFVSSLAGLVVVLLMIGVANACFHPQALTAARRFAGDREHFGIAVMLLGGEVGRGTWPLIAGVVVAALGLQGLWLPALIALLSVPLVLLVLPAPATQSGEWRVSLKGRMQPAAQLLAYASLRGMVVMGAVTYMPLVWEARGGGLVGGASLVTLMLIVGIAGTLYGSHLADRFGRRPLMIGASLLMAASMVVVALSGVIGLWLGAALLGIPAFATYPLTTVLGQDIFPENRPFGSGIALGLGNALGAALVAIMGLGASLVPLSALFWILAVAALLMAPLASGKQVSMAG